jgi:hypothetical protein
VKRPRCDQWHAQPNGSQKLIHYLKNNDMTLPKIRVTRGNKRSDQGQNMARKFIPWCAALAALVMTPQASHAALIAYQSEPGSGFTFQNGDTGDTLGPFTMTGDVTFNTATNALTGNTLSVSGPNFPGETATTFPFRGLAGLTHLEFEDAGNGDEIIVSLASALGTNATLSIEFATPIPILDTTPGNNHFISITQAGGLAPVTSAPEPATLALLGVGLTGVTAVRRARRKSQ